MPAWTPPAVQGGLDRCFGGDRTRTTRQPDPLALLLLAAEDLPQLAAALAQPVQAVIELPPEVPGVAPGELLPEAGTGDAWATAALANEWLAVPSPPPGTRWSLYLSLTTVSAYRLPCATLVCDALVQRGLLSPDQRSGTELGLQEAIANALIHGNLGLDSNRRIRGGDPGAFSRRVAAALADPERGRRRLRLLLCWAEGRRLALTVSDQGSGFAPERLERLPGGAAHFGRGFLLMRALAAQVRIGDGGRCTVLHFEV